MQPTPVFLPGESQGRGSLLGCRLWGHTESDTTKATYSSSSSMEVRVPSLMTSLLFLTYHRQPSRGPVEASRLLSVSEASVCSVDMDEMSLMDDD